LRLRRAPSGYVIWGVFFAMTIFGYYRVSKYNNASSNYLRETREAKMAIFPYRKVTFLLYSPRAIALLSLFLTG
jgi:hypothetical protein